MILRMKRVVLLGIALSFVQSPIADAQGTTTSDSWYARSKSVRDFETAKGLPPTFTIELPKAWQIVPGYGGIVFIAASEKNNRTKQSPAAIILEQMQLRTPIGPGDINATLANIEGDLVRGLPGGQNFKQEVKDVDNRRFIFIQYSKPGLNGTDHVAQYSIPSGAVMYRLICIAPEAELAKYQSMFAHVAASFKAS